jgi:hypothetical protein
MLAQVPFSSYNTMLLIIPSVLEGYFVPWH